MIKEHAFSKEAAQDHMRYKSAWLPKKDLRGAVYMPCVPALDFVVEVSPSMTELKSVLSDFVLQPLVKCPDTLSDIDLVAY